jgi:hypothetical protein
VEKVVRANHTRAGIELARWPVGISMEMRARAVSGLNLKRYVRARNWLAGEDVEAKSDEANRLRLFGGGAALAQCDRIVLRIESRAQAEICALQAWSGEVNELGLRLGLIESKASLNIGILRRRSRGAKQHCGYQQAAGPKVNAERERPRSHGETPFGWSAPRSRDLRRSTCA